jgi:hypothetical protein
VSAGHDSRFIPREFFGHLGKKGINGTDLSEAMTAAGLPRPSTGSPAWRSLILRLAASMPGCDGWELAEAIRPAYRPEAHDGDGGVPDMPPAPPAEDALAPLPAPESSAWVPRPMPRVIHPPSVRQVVTVPAPVPGAQIRWLLRLARAGAPEAAAMVGRMTEAQRVAARAAALRVGGPEMVRAAGVLA